MYYTVKKVATFGGLTESIGGRIMKAPLIKYFYYTLHRMKGDYLNFLNNEIFFWKGTIK